LGVAGAWLNVLNLIPVWILDGGQAVLVLNKMERVALLTACLALWLFLGENVFFLVAAGATWRLFTKDVPTKPSFAIAAYYIGVLTALGMVLRAVAGQGVRSPLKAVQPPAPRVPRPLRGQYGTLTTS
jgi:Zn-dependent protease